VKLVSSWMTVGRRRPVFPADCPRAWRLLCEACWVLPPSPPEPASQESRLDLIARHKLAMDARPTLSQIKEILDRRIESVDWEHIILPEPAAATAAAAASATAAAADSDGGGEDSSHGVSNFEAFLSGIGLEDKQTELAEYLTNDDKLAELKEYDDAELDEDILDDIGFDAQTKERFREALRELKNDKPAAGGASAPASYRNEAWDALLQLVGAQHAVQLQQPGTWLSAEELRERAEAQSHEIQRLRAELAAASVELDPN
jgi:hypothetical protein